MNSIFGSKALYSARVQRALVSAAFLFSVFPARSQGQGPGQGQAPIQLPEGKGKAIVETACVQCHGLERIARSGFTREEWQQVMNRQVMSGAFLPADQMAVVIDYLAANFPDKSPKAVLVPGRVEVSIKEWTVPTPGSRPHDPLVAPDGSIWYTGQVGQRAGAVRS